MVSEVPKPVDDDLGMAARIAMFPLMLAAVFRRLAEYAHAHH